MRHGDVATLAAPGPAIAAGYVGGRSSLVQEHDPLGIQVELTLESVLARLHHVGTTSLSGVRIPLSTADALAQEEAVQSAGADRRTLLAQAGAQVDMQP
ncbi:hypothetical protein D3273_18230 [Lichenibacterium minor]|uniref:Uncharacterized protein n=1 Tax=Lichenibacterium minor TaxID=2316528 RepID=A0A4Q2U666_9HYPH|nr:hypothetical protein [Lichenibacterium minor]RYC30477.1 hypothetical protein D3273_18230 [Lichenibacterium minor]